MTQRLVIVGAGGFGREVLDVVEAINFDHATTGTTPFDVLGFLDDGQPDAGLLAAYGAKHLGPVSNLADLPADVGYVIGIGDPAVRRAIDEQGGGRPCPVLVHPSATVGRQVEFGPGTVVCSHVSLTNHIRLGRHVHVNLNSTIGHDARIGDYVTLSPLVAVSGNVTIKDSVLVGSGATINPGLTVHRASTVGAGAAVIRDVLGRTTVGGVPAKPLV